MENRVRSSGRSVVGRWPNLLLAAFCLLSASAFGTAEGFVLKGGKLLTVSHGVIENGVLVMSGGKITALGTAGSVSIPKNAQVIDVTGMTVYPGIDRFGKLSGVD